MEKRHSGGDLFIYAACGERSGNPILQMGMHFRRPLDQRDMRAKRGKQKRIAAETRRCVDDCGRAAFGETGSLWQCLSPSFTRAQPVTDSSADEINDKFLTFIFPCHGSSQKGAGMRKVTS